MTPESDGEIEGSDWERPVVFPVFQMPARLATGVALGLVISAVLSIIDALVTALTYRQAGSPGEALPRGISFPSVVFADRVSLFATRAGTLTVALLVVVAVVVVGMAARPGEARAAATRWRVLLVAASAIGLVVILANVAEAVVILTKTTVYFSAELFPNRLSSVLALLPAALSAAAAVGYALTRLRSASEVTRDDGDRAGSDA